MNNLPIVVAALAAALAPAALNAQSTRDSLATNLLASARSFRCRFDNNTFTRLDSLPPKSEAWGNYDVVFDHIDRQHGQAKALGPTWEATVQVVPSAHVLSFVWITRLGDVTLFTVFPRLAPRSPETLPLAELLAVASTHSMLSDVAAIQDYGRCRSVGD